MGEKCNCGDCGCDNIVKIINDMPDGVYKLSALGDYKGDLAAAKIGETVQVERRPATLGVFRTYYLMTKIFDNEVTVAGYSVLA